MKKTGWCRREEIIGKLSLLKIYQYKYKSRDPLGHGRRNQEQQFTHTSNRQRIPAAGLPLLSDGKNAYVDNEDTHSLIFGSTGSKKTRLFCMPMIGMFIRAGESFVATDPKGELYRKTSGMAKDYGYKTVVLNFRDIGKGDFWNPLGLPYDLYHAGDKEGATVLLNDFVSTLAAPQFERTNDTFWPEMASAYALANLLFLMECADKSEANVSSLASLCSGDVADRLR